MSDITPDYYHSEGRIKLMLWLYYQHATLSNVYQLYTITTACVPFGKIFATQ